MSGKQKYNNFLFIYADEMNHYKNNMGVFIEHGVSTWKNYRLHVLSIVWSLLYTHTNIGGVLSRSTRKTFSFEELRNQVSFTLRFLTIIYVSPLWHYVRLRRRHNGHTPSCPPSVFFSHFWGYGATKKRNPLCEPTIRTMAFKPQPQL